MSRQTKLTPVIQERIMQAIRVGATYRLACLYGGISEDTLARWRDLGKKGRKPYADFADAFEKAEGSAAIAWLAHIEKAAMDGQWTASAWRLERRFPREYGRTVQEHTGPEGGPVQTEIRVVYADEREAKS